MYKLKVMKWMFIVLSMLFSATNNLNGQVFQSEKDSLYIEESLAKIGYPDGYEINGLSNIVFAVLYFNKRGGVDSVVTSTKSILGDHIKKKLMVTNGKWNMEKKCANIPIVIPFLFLINDDESLEKRLKVDYLSELWRDNNKWLENKLLLSFFHKPVLILGFPPISKTNN